MEYAKDPMHCPRDPSIECLKCHFETCVYDEPEEAVQPQEHPLNKRVRVLSEKEKARNCKRSKEYYWRHRDEIMARANTPEEKARRKAYRDKLYSDPAKLAERRRKGLESYYRHREEILKKARDERMRKKNEENHDE